MVTIALYALTPIGAGILARLAYRFRGTPAGRVYAAGAVVSLTVAIVLLLEHSA